ncbi:MAG: GGDEF domain-containing protein [Gammaproteobacteria bacterium]|nr:GGDEF domain-containing protein [Gammaproteobacteria bacterium]MCP5198929.1 GGDEF domain-containing protein [Gammaproteobacteria bacterium]
MAATAPTLPDDWKDKYVKALNAFDDQERKWHEQLERIGRDLLAMLEHFRGRHAQFDRTLDTAANALGNGGDPLVDALRATLTAYERFLAEDAGGTAPAAATGDDDGRASLLGLVEILQAEIGPRTELDEVHHLLSAADVGIDAAIATCARQLGTILGGASAAEPVRARDTLQALLDHLSLPEAVQARLNALTPRLQQADDEAELRDVAKELANVVIEYVGTLQSEIAGLNGFLRAVKGRLDDVSQHIGLERADRKRAAAARETLDTTVRRSLNDIQGQVESAADIDALKQAIQRQIAIIDDSVDDYLGEESRHASGAEAALAALEAKVANLTRESESLRDKLAEARASATRDTLTGLPNRLAYNDRLAIELARMRRAGTPLALAVLDLDRFKSINDTWGHQAGDRVLKHLAREIGSQVRTQDLFARFGGEEFVLLLPETGIDGAARLCDALRRHIAGCRFKYKDTPVAVTISCGITEFAAGEAEGSAFERADRGLYAAKRNGRNRCEVVRA